MPHKIKPEYKMILYPKNYNNLSFDYENCIEFDSIIEVTWSEDSYALYYAENKRSNDTLYTTRLTSNAIRGVSAIAMNPIAVGGTASNLIEAHGQETAKYQKAQDTQDSLGGNQSSVGLLLNENRFGYTIYQMSVDLDTAKCIDNYFSCYGYAVKRVKKPNLYKSNAHLRQYWNYLQTQNCHIAIKNNGINEKNIQKIEDIFNKRVTFWEVLTINENDDISHTGDYDYFGFVNPTT